MKIVVLSGGFSPEKNISLASGKLIANALLKRGYDVMLVDLYLGKNNKELPLIYRNKNNNEKYSFVVERKKPNLERLKIRSGNGEKLIGDGVLQTCIKSDVVFMALHGDIGENGKLQALFDIYGVNYTGSGFVGSMLAMDKDLSKRIIRSKGILTPKWHFMTKKEEIDFSEVELPCVIKPCSCGSSVGVSMVTKRENLVKAIDDALKYENEILIEKMIKGREFSVGIIDGKALPVIEIKPKKGFYDYNNKYKEGATIETCPANISEELTIKLQRQALGVHKALKLGYYSRVDFIVDSNNDCYFLEANTLPGMTETSLLPQEAIVDGISFEDLCEKIVLNSIKNNV